MSRRDFVASREELVAVGFSRSQIKNWVRGGRLITVLKSVYSYGRDVESVQALRRAALLASGRDSALTARSACEAWGLTKSFSDYPRLIQTGSPKGQTREYSCLSPLTRGSKVHVSKRTFTSGDLTTHGGLTLVRPALALLDIAAYCSDRDVRFAFLEACRLKLFTEIDLSYCGSRFQRRRGAGRIRPLLALWIPELERIRSVLEGWFLLEWVAHRYPVPRVNEKLLGFEVDFYWPEYGLALEVDGDAFHGDPAQKRIDHEKTRFLESRVIVVIRISYREFAADPSAAVSSVARKQNEIGIRPSALLA